jgi:hypothetical protein
VGSSPSGALTLTVPLAVPPGCGLFMVALARYWREPQVQHGHRQASRSNARPSARRQRMRSLGRSLPGSQIADRDETDLPPRRQHLLTQRPTDRRTALRHSPA